MTWRWAAGIAVLAAVAAAAWWTQRPRAPRLPEPPWPAWVTVLAGDGRVGWRDGRADRSRLAEPFGVAVAADGTIYFSDAGDSHRIRTISPTGQVSTVAGGGGGFADGAGATARFSTPSGLAIDAAGVLYIADTGNNAIRRLSPEGGVTTMAGSGVAGDLDGRAGQAQFNGPVGVAVDARGRVLVAETYNDRIRAIAPDGQVTTLAGSDMPGALDGPGPQASFDTPCGLAVDAAGRILVADTGNGLIRTIEPTGVVTTHTQPIVGVDRPIGIAVTAAGDVYVSDEQGRIIEIPSKGDARRLAGTSVGYEDGPGGTARFRRLGSLALAASNRVVVADAGNALVRLVAPPAWRTTLPPSSPGIAPAFDDQQFARTPLIWPVAPLEGPHEVAGTFGEARGEQGSERFHAGLDVREEQGTPVRAVRDGTVTSPVSTGAFATINEWLRVGPVTYVHLRAGRSRDDGVDDLQRFAPVYDASGLLVRMRAKRGARFAAGDVVGSINRFNHVHLNIGWPGNEHNPLQFRLVEFVDTVPPTIARGGIRLFDEQGQPLTTRVKRRLVVRGRVQIVVDAWDQAEGNVPSRRLGLYALGYQVLARNGTPVPGFESPLTTIRFDQLRSGSDAARRVFASGSGIPVYGQRRTQFLYVVTTTYRDGVATPGYWDTSALVPGDYVLRVIAEDFHGNQAVANRDVAVTVVP
ncbi:MAG: gluconolaconase [Luteitalea sp.]